MQLKSLLSKPQQRLLSDLQREIRQLFQGIHLTTQHIQHPIHIKKINKSIGEEYIGDLVHHVRQETERQERTVRAQLKIKKRKNYNDGYEELNRIWEDIVRGIKKIDIEISINKKNKW